MVAQSHSGDTLHLQVLRKSKTVNVDVRSGVRPSETQLRADNDNNQDQDGDAPQGTPGPKPSALGMSFGPLDEAAHRRYAIPATVRGVVVESVSASSDAGKKGLRRGDVIVRAGDQEATSPTDVPSAVDAAKRAGRTSVLLQVYRAGRNQFVAIKIQP